MVIKKTQSNIIIRYYFQCDFLFLAKIELQNKYKILLLKILFVSIWN